MLKLRATSFLTALLLTFAFSLAGALPTQKVQAETTSSVQVATVSGATYLTTTTISTTSTVVATPTPIVTPLPQGTPIVLPQPIGTSTLPSGFFPNASVLVNQIFRIIMVVSIILVFAYLVLGGIQYIMSGGEKAKTEAARNKITSAIIGLIIVASSYAILTVALNFIGYKDSSNLFNITFFPTVTPTPIVTPLPTPLPTPTPTPTSALQKLLQ